MQLGDGGCAFTVVCLAASEELEVSELSSREGKDRETGLATVSGGGAGSGGGGGGGIVRGRGDTGKAPGPVSFTSIPRIPHQQHMVILLRYQATRFSHSLPNAAAAAAISLPNVAAAVRWVYRALHAGGREVIDGADVSLSATNNGEDPMASPWGVLGGLKVGGGGVGFIFYFLLQNRVNMSAIY